MNATFEGSFSKFCSLPARFTNTLPNTFPSCNQYSHSLHTHTHRDLFVISKASVTRGNFFCNLCCKAIAKAFVRGVTRSNDLCSFQRRRPRILKLRLKSLNCDCIKGTLALQVAKIDVTHCYGYENACNRCKK